MCFPGDHPAHVEIGMNFPPQHLAKNPAVDLGVGDYKLSGLKKAETFVGCVHECLLTEARSEGMTPSRKS